MPDRNKVIEGLEYLITAYAFHGEDAECLGDALELLKEQEPIIIKRPERLDEIYDYIAYCPECHMQWAMRDSEKMRYCPGCGRSVKWDD